MRFSSSRRNGRKQRSRQKGKNPIIRYGLSHLKIYDDKVSVDEGRDSACIDIDPLAEQEEEDGPPYIIAVQGPPKVGKTLLIKSLVEFYTKGKGGDGSNMGTGPIRIIAGDTRRRRVQFVECPNNVNAMIDASKYADAVIFLIDAGYNFEMETFEFLELLKVHGMPKVIGVLTYLDSFKNDDMRANAQQYLMDQFQTNICKGAALFCLSGLDNVANRYLEHEIEQLATYISTMEFHPLSWRAALGPFMLVDHFFDVTPLGTAVNMDTKYHRDVILKGYLRGCHIKDGTMVHIAGVGDFRLARMTTLADPFPVDSHLSESTSCMENRAGAYVSFEFHDVPFEMVKNHNPCQPLLIGGITIEEDVEEEVEVGYIQVKLERHNWHLKLLKSKDPIIVSIGWRRYETRPIYALEDSHGRYRFLRRTPPNRPCFAMFWGPLPTPNTQLAVLQSLADKKAAFRFSAKGFVVDVNQAAQIVKKSKRIGTPCKISRKTALVKDMLKSDLEIADFKDAKIQTASGIDGKIIESAAGEDVIGEGIAKCTFTHKIRKCDTILMNVYEQVVIPRLFNPRSGPDPPDRIWVRPVYTFKASHIPVTSEIINNKKETSKVFAKGTHFLASYCSMTSQSEKLLCKQQQHVIIAKLEELEREQEELRRIRKQLIERAPSQWVQLLKRAPRRRGTLEQLRSVHFVPSGNQL